MSKGLKKAGKIIGGIEDWMVIVLFTAMVVVTMAIVLCRYVFKVQFVPGEEIARYLMIWCGYAGAAMGFRTHAHVGVVVFAEKFPKSWQPVIIKIRHIISTAVVAILFVVSCNCFMQYVDSGKLTTATHIPTAVVMWLFRFPWRWQSFIRSLTSRKILFRQKRKQQKVRARKYDRNNFIRYIFSITCNWCSYRIVSRRCSVTGCIYFRRCKSDRTWTANVRITGQFHHYGDSVIHAGR